MKLPERKHCVLATFVDNLPFPGCPTFPKFLQERKQNHATASIRNVQAEGAAPGLPGDDRHLNGLTAHIRSVGVSARLEMIEETSVGWNNGSELDSTIAGPGCHGSGVERERQSYMRCHVWKSRILSAYGWKPQHTHAGSPGFNTTPDIAYI